MTDDQIQEFIERWSRSGGAERANYVSFLNKLCDVLEVPPADPTLPDDDQNAYVFDRRVIFKNPDDTESYGYIDLYKRGCFVLESKQGVEKKDDEELLSTASQERKKRRKKGHSTVGSTAWNDTLPRARGQAEQYARSLTAPETRPPFLVVVDVGHTIDLYSEFTQTGGTYVQFPDAASHRIRRGPLTDPAVRERLCGDRCDNPALYRKRTSHRILSGKDGG
jgi:hypothetical protein